MVLKNYALDEVCRATRTFELENGCHRDIWTYAQMFVYDLNLSLDNISIKKRDVNGYSQNEF